MKAFLLYCRGKECLGNSVRRGIFKGSEEFFGSCTFALRAFIQKRTLSCIIFIQPSEMQETNSTYAFPVPFAFPGAFLLSQTIR